MALTTSEFSSPAAPVSSAPTLSPRLSTHNEIVVFDNLHRNALQLRISKATRTCTSSRATCWTSTATRKAIDGCQVVIHCAAIAGVYTVDRSAVRTMEVNLLGTHQVVKAALEVGVERFVEFSTSEVYGAFIHKGKEDDFTPIGPIGESRWVYAASKLASEHLSYAHYREDNLPLAIVRPFNVYGPRQVGDGAIRGMTLQALRTCRSRSTTTARRFAPGVSSPTSSTACCAAREPGSDRPRLQYRQPAGHGDELRARQPDHPPDQFEIGDRLQAASRSGSRTARAGDREGDDAARLPPDGLARGGRLAGDRVVSRKLRPSGKE